jgi:signal transduction histidine kinase/DNA-binding response OmpR family regulator
MKFLLKCFFLFLPIFIYSQNTIEDTIVISKKSFAENITDELIYITSDKELSTSAIFENKIKLQKYNDTILLNQFPLFAKPKYIYLKGVFQNKTNDTVKFILTTSNSIKTEVFLHSKYENSKRIIGFKINQKDAYAEEIHSSMEISLLPLEQKSILLKKQLFVPKYDRISKISIYSNDRFESMLLDYYRTNHTITLLFSLLSGGLFLLFFYNFFMFFKTKVKTYLYYSAYLLFTFLNLFLIIDRVQMSFIGKIMFHFTLVQELTYTLSFIFYTLFAQSILIKSTPRIKKLFTICVAFMVSYLVYIFVFSYINHSNVTIYDIIIGLSFRIISLIFASIIIYQLFKQYHQLYIKYIFIGSLILTSSYLLHVIFNIIEGPKLSNHFFNLFGALLEILFFTYALHIKTLEIEKSKAKVENLNDLKSRFFTNISHEFRTPLTLIKSPVQSLLSKSTDEAEIKQLTLIDKSSNRMLELVDQLLELSKLDSGTIKLLLKEGNINSFMHNLVEPYEVLAIEHDLRFIKSIEQFNQNYFFDKDVTEKIITNLLTNAIKYTQPNGEINFEFKVTNSNFIILISNETDLLKKEDLSTIFDYFYQKDNSKVGFGIGLTLVKELVELYQGSIAVSLVDKKVQFYIELPTFIENQQTILIKQEKIASEEIKTTDLISDHPLLMIVDDNEEIRFILKDIFKNEFNIKEAKDGEQALQIALKEIPDCIISDVMMPKMNGFEFTKAIKSNEITSFIPVILLTAKSSDEAHLEGLKSTADAYLTKPFNNDIVKETVNQLIAERKKLHDRYSKELVLKPTDIVINSVDEKFLDKLQLILNQELSNADITADDFASQMGMSRMQLHRKLKSLLGVSATEFLRKERLKMAATLLEKGNGNISEIIYSVGFNDVSYFNRCFREMYHCTPSEYQNRV